MAAAPEPAPDPVAEARPLRRNVRRRWALGGFVLAAGAVGVALWATQRWRQRHAPDQRLAYKALPGGALHLDHFQPVPTGAAAPAPGLLLFHGGGWAFGSPQQFHGPARALSRRLGLHVFCVEYRIRSRHGSTPADAVQDARDAIRHVRRHAAALGVDAGRLAAGGGSAGGHLAACLGTGAGLPDVHGAHGPAAAQTLADTRPQALVLLNPMLDLSPGRPDHAEVAAQWQALSPHHHVGPGLPPTLVLSGTQDAEVPVATVQAFCARVQAAGSRCEALFFEGAGHGFFNAEVAGGRYARPTWEAVGQFLRQQGLTGTPG
jgi:acetyl esterase